MAIYRLWPATNGPATPDTDPTDYTLGVEFEVTSAADLIAYYFWHASGQGGGTKDFRTWSVTTATTGSAVSGTDASNGAWTAGAWNRVPLASPVALTPTQRYRAGIAFTVANGYSSTANYWSSGAGSAGITNGPLYAPNNADSVGARQSPYVDVGTPTYPSLTFNASNYWLDVEVDDGVEPDPGVIPLVVESPRLLG